GKDENFFLLNVQPPGRIAPDQLPQRDYLFIVDVSGSMDGFPLTTAKSLMRDLISGLKSGDTFNLLLFAGSSQVFSQNSVPANAANIESALNFMDRSSAGGGTELLRALQRAFDLPAKEDASRTIAIITDGYVNIEQEAFQLVREKLHHGNVFSFGIGTA